jgi:hypothetical protein
MRMNRGLVFWGIALVTAGLVALAIQTGIIPEETARQAWGWWPVVLIVLGIAVIAGRSPFAMLTSIVAGLVVGSLVGTLVAGWPDGLSIGCGGQTDDQIAADGAFEAAAADVELDFDCGELAVAMGDGSGWRVDARHAAGAEPSLESGADSLRVEADAGTSFLGFGDARQAWDVTLPAEVELALGVSANAASSRLDLAGALLSTLTIDANAGEVILDLAGASVEDMNVEANAGSLGVTVDESTVASASVQMNAGSLELCVPEDATVSISVNDDNVTFSHDLDDSGLTRDGDTWRSGDDPVDVAFEIQGNAASLSYNPDGGCS